MAYPLLAAGLTDATGLVDLYAGVHDPFAPSVSLAFAAILLIGPVTAASPEQILIATGGSIWLANTINGSSGNWRLVTFEPGELEFSEVTGLKTSSTDSPTAVPDGIRAVIRNLSFGIDES